MKNVIAFIVVLLFVNADSGNISDFFNGTKKILKRTRTSVSAGYSIAENRALFFDLKFKFSIFQLIV